VCQGSLALLLRKIILFSPVETTGVNTTTELILNAVTILSQKLDNLEPPMENDEQFGELNAHISGYAFN
jgi:hypothetical protein